jgi:hypothetical protein
MNCGFMDVILSHSVHQHVSATRALLQGGDNKNTNVIKMRLNHCTFKN